LDDQSGSWFNMLDSQSVSSDGDSDLSNSSNENTFNDLKSSDNSDVLLDGDLWNFSDLDNV